MQLRVARLCLDCDEVHDAQACPICGSESFAYITRWVPAPERRARPRPEPSSETADAYRALLSSTPQQSGVSRWVRRGAFGLAALGVAGWVWRSAGQRTNGDDEIRKSSE